MKNIFHNDPVLSNSALSLEQHITMHHPTVETTVTSVYRNLCAIVLHLSLCLYLDPYICLFLCPCVFLCFSLSLCLFPCLFLCLFLCIFPCLCLCLCPSLCNGGSCDDCAQDSDLCAVFLVAYAGFACAAYCVHYAPAYRLPQHVTGCSHGDVDGGGDGGGCCYDGGGYELRSEFPSCLAPPHPPLPPPCL